MIRLAGMIITGILTSLYYFPIEFMALPGINTKMVLAVLGLVFVVFYVLKKKSLLIPRELLLLIALASGVSLMSLISITVNQTPDDSYANYITSFFVWLSGAFAVCTIVKFVHGHISVHMVLNYLVAVCLFQCVSVLLVYNNPDLAQLVTETIFSSELHVASQLGRLFGFGAALDTAGVRFSLVLVGIAFFLSGIKGPLPLLQRLIYIISFIVISIIGNMVARTTIVGVGIGLVFLVISSFISIRGTIGISQFSSLFSWLGLIATGVVISVILYNTAPQARSLYRFAFEGFFSLVEKGEWETSSGEKLKTMVVYPETLHTWVIGDGYFENSRNDENYLGDATDQGYYMGTDVGYLRFIFYFGILGLIPMMGVIIYSSVMCIKYFRDERWLFILALLVGLIVWLKVATDIFCFLALFLSVAALREPEEGIQETLNGTLILNKDSGRKISARSGIV